MSLNYCQKGRGKADRTCCICRLVRKMGAWICACQLKITDKVLLSDGSCATIEAIEVEKLAVPQTTHNFEVANFHTYYVGNLSILCHNRCKLAKNMEKAGTKFKPDEDAHHLYPNQFREKFKEIGIEIDDAANGIVMNKNTHRAGAYAYNKLWAEVIDSVTIENAPQYMRKFMKIVYGIS